MVIFPASVWGKRETQGRYMIWDKWDAWDSRDARDTWDSGQNGKLEAGKLKVKTRWEIGTQEGQHYREIPDFLQTFGV